MDTRWREQDEGSSWSCPILSTHSPRPTWEVGAGAAVAPADQPQLQVAGGAAGVAGNEQRAARVALAAAARGCKGYID